MIAERLGATLRLFVAEGMRVRAVYLDRADRAALESSDDERIAAVAGALTFAGHPVRWSLGKGPSRIYSTRGVARTVVRTPERPEGVQGRDRLTPDQVREIAELREAGWSIARLAARFGRSPGAIAYHCLRQGARSPNARLETTGQGGQVNGFGQSIRRFTAEEDAELLRLAGAGLPIAAICRKLNRATNSVKMRLMTLELRREAAMPEPPAPTAPAPIQPPPAPVAAAPAPPRRSGPAAGTAFEEQLARVRAGRARLAPAWTPPGRPIDQTLGGVASGLL